MSTPTAKQPRGRPPKSSHLSTSQSDLNAQPTTLIPMARVAADSSSDQVTTEPPLKRGRGRPPKAKASASTSSSKPLPPYMLDHKTFRPLASKGYDPKERAAAAARSDSGLSSAQRQGTAKRGRGRPPREQTLSSDAAPEISSTSPAAISTQPQSAKRGRGSPPKPTLASTIAPSTQPQAAKKSRGRPPKATQASTATVRKRKRSEDTEDYREMREVFEKISAGLSTNTEHLKALSGLTDHIMHTRERLDRLESAVGAIAKRMKARPAGSGSTPHQQAGVSSSPAKKTNDPPESTAAAPGPATTSNGSTRRFKTPTEAEEDSEPVSSSRVFTASTTHTQPSQALSQTQTQSTLAPTFPTATAPRMSPSRTPFAALRQQQEEEEHIATRAENPQAVSIFANIIDRFGGGE